MYLSILYEFHLLSTYFRWSVPKPRRYIVRKEFFFVSSRLDDIFWEYEVKDDYDVKYGLKTWKFLKMRKIIVNVIQDVDVGNIFISLSEFMESEAPETLRPWLPYMENLCHTPSSIWGNLEELSFTISCENLKCFSIVTRILKKFLETFEN